MTNTYKELASVLDKAIFVIDHELSDKEKQELGEISLELLGDYPLYSNSSNISYAEAIALAHILFGEDLKEYYTEQKEQEKDFQEYMEYCEKNKLPISFDDFGKWKREVKNA